MVQASLMKSTASNTRSCKHGKYIIYTLVHLGTVRRLSWLWHSLYIHWHVYTFLKALSSDSCNLIWILLVLPWAVVNEPVQSLQSVTPRCHSDFVLGPKVDQQMPQHEPPRRGRSVFWHGSDSKADLQVQKQMPFGMMWMSSRTIGQPMRSLWWNRWPLIYCRLYLGRSGRFGMIWTYQINYEIYEVSSWCIPLKTQRPRWIQTSRAELVHVGS